VTVQPSTPTVFTGGGPGAVWVDPGNCQISDDTYTTTTLTSVSDVSQLLVCTGLDFSVIPDGSVIQQIRVTVEAARTLGSASISSLRAWNGSMLKGTEQISSPQVLTATDTNYTFGSGLWSFWTLARLQTSSHGVALRCTWISGASATPRIDYIFLSVTYFAPGGYYAACHAHLVVPSICGD
jgi:hypothetical protein